MGQDLSSRADAYIIANDVLMGLSFLAIVARCCSRVWLSKRGLWWDDFFIFLAFVGLPMRQLRLRSHVLTLWRSSYSCLRSERPLMFPWANLAGTGMSGKYLRI